MFPKVQSWLTPFSSQSQPIYRHILRYPVLDAAFLICFFFSVALFTTPNQKLGFWAGPTYTMDSGCQLSMRDSVGPLHFEWAFSYHPTCCKLEACGFTVPYSLHWLGPWIWPTMAGGYAYLHHTEKEVREMNVLFLPTTYQMLFPVGSRLHFPHSRGCVGLCYVNRGWISYNWSRRGSKYFFIDIILTRK